jgi:hypothetical protein
VASAGAADEAFVVEIPGVSRTVAVRPPGFLSGAKLLVDGEPARKVGFIKRAIPLDAGGELEVKIIDGLSGLSLVAGRQRYPVGPRIPAVLGILVFLPIGLVAVGGALGGGFGAAGMVLNKSVARSGLTLGAKIAAMIGITLGAAFLTILFAGLLAVALGRV